MGANSLTVEVYSSGTTRITDADSSLQRVEGLQFATTYPGGLYGDASFYVPRDVLRSWALRGAQRVILRNGAQAVYEGYLSNLQSAVEMAGQGQMVRAIGGWGHILMARRWRKWWADQRLSDDVWRTGIAGCVTEKVTDDRNSRIQFTPKSEAFGNGEYVQLYYTSPTGETVKRVVFDYNLTTSAAAPKWTLYLLEDGGGTEWSVARTTAGSSSATGQDVTLAAPGQHIYFRFESNDAQTPASDGSVFGRIANLTVYSETGAINLTEIAKDVRAHLTELNTGEALIGSNTYSLVPFMSDWDTCADILTGAASFGDSSFNRWACGLRCSELAVIPNGEPVLFVEQYPALTDYEYAIRLDEADGDIVISQDFDDIWNWIVVEWIDERGVTQYTTPDDDANLKDTTSITAYGQRDYLLSVGYSTAAVATNNGRRFLARYKDPQWHLSGPIVKAGIIRGKGGNLIPVSQVQAGKRIRVEDYYTNLSGTGLTFVISQTDYDDDSETVTINTGVPDDLIYPTYQAPGYDINTVDEYGAGGVGGGGGVGEVSRLNWKRRMGLKPGTPEWEAAARATPAEKRRMLEELKQKKRGRG